jgi:antitoxin PrlF
VIFEKANMTITQLTGSGKVEIPSEIIEWLKLQPGDLIYFPIAPDGKVYLQPAKIDVRELSGMLYEAVRNYICVPENYENHALE